MALVPGSGLFHLNALATLIALGLEEGQPRQQIAQTVAACCGIDPSAAKRSIGKIEGLLRTRAALGHPISAAQDKPVLSWRPATLDLVEAREVRHYRLLGTCFTCRFLDMPSVRLAGEAFASLEALRVGPSVVHLDVAVRDGQAIIIRDAEQLDEAAAPEMLVNLLRLVLTETALNRCGEGWAVHAAAAARGRRAVLLPGPSGQGKSTLALGLAASGWTILAEDTAVLAAETLEIRGLPFALCLKAGSWALAKEWLGKDATLIPGRRLDGCRVRWLLRAPGLDLAETDARAVVEHVVFPTFARGAEPTLRALDREEALQRLLPGLHALGAGPTADKVDRLIGWIGERPCSDLRYGDLDQGVAAVTGLLA